MSSQYPNGGVGRGEANNHHRYDSFGWGIMDKRIQYNSQKIRVEYSSAQPHYDSNYDFETISMHQIFLIQHSNRLHSTNCQYIHRGRSYN